MSLRQLIEREIRERGPIPFSRYMELCLYHPTEGYYSRTANQFGKAGDFYTSSDVHAVFGRLMARQFEEMWRALDRPAKLEILELGPGRGLFARDVLDWSKKKFPDFFVALTYTLQESSAALREKLAENLKDSIAGGKVVLPRVPDASSMGAQLERSCPFEIPLIVFANEFFDALPVEILSANGKLHLVSEKGRITEKWLAASDEELELLDRYGVHPEAGERIEVAAAAQEWAAAIAAAVSRGFVLTIDYGYTRAEQLAGRHRGTLMAYREHSTSPDPYQAPGEQDLTAHVNFTALDAAFMQAAMATEKLTTQAQFLMGIGEKNEFADAFEDCRLPQERAKVALQLKHLVTPAGMGESFHVLMASRAVEPERVDALSGLRFSK